jgi:tetratricopeptide (TPR) repeat protein
MAEVQESLNILARYDSAPAALTKTKEAEAELKNLHDFITSKLLDDPDFNMSKHAVLLQLVDADKDNAMWEDALTRYSRLENDREFWHLHIDLEIWNILADMQQYDQAMWEDALTQIVPKSFEVASEICDRMTLVPQAIEYPHPLFNLLPVHPAIWRKFGSIWDKDGNETQAFHCFSESEKYCPHNMWSRSRDPVLITNCDTELCRCMVRLQGGSLRINVPLSTNILDRTLIDKYPRAPTNRNLVVGYSNENMSFRFHSKIP